MARWTKQANMWARLGTKIAYLSTSADACQGQDQHEDCLHLGICTHDTYQVGKTDKLGTKITYILASIPMIPTKLARVS